MFCDSEKIGVLLSDGFVYNGVCHVRRSFRLVSPAQGHVAGRPVVRILDDFAECGVVAVFIGNETQIGP